MASIVDQTRPDQNCALISVIVPAYNVERYIARCLDSILSQTYTNLEVLLIDDGSTDSTGRICDDYARKDGRVRVIHQENQGLAEVRNIGLHEAKGEWIQFIDSDDWIEPETIGTCYDLALKNDAEIVCFQYVYEYESEEYGSRKTNHGDNRYYSDRIMSGEEAFSVVMFPSYINESSCNKLIKTDILDGIEYPRGKTGEDIYTTYMFVIRARRVIYIAKEFYHYFQNGTSISHTHKTGQLYSGFYAAEEYIDFALSRNLDRTQAYIDNIMAGAWFKKVGVVNHMIMGDLIDSEYILKIQKEIKPYIIIKSQLSPVRKIQLLLFKFSFRLYAMVYMRTKRK